jgi:hypothetical protein
MLNSTNDPGKKLVRERGLPVDFENYAWTAPPRQQVSIFDIFSITNSLFF